MSNCIFRGVAKIAIKTGSGCCGSDLNVFPCTSPQQPSQYCSPERHFGGELEGAGIVQGNLQMIKLVSCLACPHITPPEQLPPVQPMPSVYVDENRTPAEQAVIDQWMAQPHNEWRRKQLGMQ